MRPPRSATQVAPASDARARRRRHPASPCLPALAAMKSSGRMPAYVVRQLSRCTAASAGASATVAARNARADFVSGNAADRLHQVLGVDAEELVDVAGGSRLAEAVDADDLALEPDILAPVVGNARFYCDARHATRKHG